jgi:hypothetical protein
MIQTNKDSNKKKKQKKAFSGTITQKPKLESAGNVNNSSKS